MGSKGVTTRQVAAAIREQRQQNEKSGGKTRIEPTKREQRLYKNKGNKARRGDSGNEESRGDREDKAKLGGKNLN